MENTIAQLRKERSVTQIELAAAVGVSRQTIISIEKGRFDPSLSLALRMSKYFGRSVEDIFTDS
jgi:putative transcriptional regulator